MMRFNSDCATKTEVLDFKLSDGEPLRFWTGALPNAVFYRSLFQQQIFILKKGHIFNANKPLKKPETIDATITFKMHPDNPMLVKLASFTDACFNTISR